MRIPKPNPLYCVNVCFMYALITAAFVMSAYATSRVNQSQAATRPTSIGGLWESGTYYAIRNNSVVSRAPRRDNLIVREYGFDMTDACDPDYDLPSCGEVDSRLCLWKGVKSFACFDTDESVLSLGEFEDSLTMNVTVFGANQTYALYYVAYTKTS